jgi:hypothetical protein
MTVNTKLSDDSRGEFETRIALGVCMAKKASLQHARQAMLDNLLGLCTGAGILAWALMYQDGNPLAWLGLPMLVVFAIGKAIHVYRAALDSHRFGHCWDRVVLAHAITVALELSPATAHRLFPARVVRQARELTEQVAKTLRHNASELEPVVSKLRAEVESLAQGEAQTKSTSAGEDSVA